MREAIPESFVLLKDFAQAEVYHHSQKAMLLVLTKINFIPMEAFKKIFGEVSELIEKHKTQSILFDKRSLTIFHQPSMEWYYLNWKAALLKGYGINKHAKILPKDDLFRQTVTQAREKIFQKTSTPALSQLEIFYFENYQEAMEGLR